GDHVGAAAVLVDLDLAVAGAHADTAHFRQLEVDVRAVQERLRRRGSAAHHEPRHVAAALHLGTHIDLELPEVRRVRVRTRDGKVQVYENRGGADVVTTDGEVRVFTPWAITEDVSIVNRGADIVFRAFHGTCGRFDVDCVNGKVAARVTGGDWRIMDSRNDQDTLHATLGTCTNRMVMRNVDAAVIISIVDNPMEYGSLFSSP
ncbi:MAG: hypothetical protein ACKOFI_04270, partial [Phycisphaerales bacterium]